MNGPDRQSWNEQQKKLIQALRCSSDHTLAQDLFMQQHALVHAGISPGLSFEDEVWDGLTDAAARRVPRGHVHSIAWLMWHTARCEDITFNLLVAGGDQVLLSGGWLEKMNITVRDTGNEMSEAELVAFNAAIDLTALREYRLAVALQTRDGVQAALPDEFQQKVRPERLARIMDEGAVVEAARYLVDYWSARTIGGLLLMPATRHHLTHINEALRVKKKRNS
jgi:hypothetical protein